MVPNRFFHKKVDADNLSLQVFLPVYSLVILAITAIILFKSRNRLFPKAKDNISTDIVLKQQFLTDFEKENKEDGENIKW